MAPARPWLAPRARGYYSLRAADHLERAALRAGLDLLRLQLRRLAIGVVQRVADQHRHPAGEQLRLPVTLDERVLAGRQEAEELGRLGEADRVRLRHRPERGDDAVLQQVGAPVAGVRGAPR